MKADEPTIAEPQDAIGSAAPDTLGIIETVQGMGMAVHDRMHQEPPLQGYDLVMLREEAVTMCAFIVHEAVRAINDAHGEVTLPWADNRVSVEAGVRRVVANPNETQEENHAAWMAYKAAEGWVYGEAKDPVAKTHPCMVPFDELRPVDRAKDAIFLAIVRAVFGEGP